MLYYIPASYTEMISKPLILVLIACLAQEINCGNNNAGVLCVSDIAFTIVAEVFNNPVDIGVRLYCPKGHHCVSDSESPCHPNYISSSITTISTTTTIRTTIPVKATDKPIESSPAFLGDINCDGPGYYPAAKCNEYYECAPLYWWFRPILATCKEGYFYSKVNKPCSMPPNVLCTEDLLS